MRRILLPTIPFVLALGTLIGGCTPDPQHALASPARAEFARADFPPEWRIPASSVVAVHARDGMVSTTDRVASEIGAEILRRGGNAIDAAVAVHFALAVVNPEAGNIGGGGFLVTQMADGTRAALDFRETAPLAATRDMFLDARGNVTDRSTVGHQASGVPGSVAGMWEAHRRFGSLPWAELVQPAVHLAEGMVVHERLAGSLRAHENRFRSHPATAAVFLPGGSVPRVGDRLEQRDLAETLRRVAHEGRDGFYLGRTADLIVAEMTRGDGLITHEDLSRYTAQWREPVVFGYRDHTVLSMPPSSSGGATIGAILKLLEGYDLRSLGWHSPQHVHLFTEAARRAFVDRNAYLADPDFVPQPVERMVSAEYAAERRAGVLPARATPSVEVEPGLGPVPVPTAARETEHTTHYSLVDRHGNAVAVTTTLNSLYGNRVTVTGAGFLLNNEMDDFTARPGTPNQFGLVQGEANAIEPGKRMLSAMTPTILLDFEGRVRLVTGSPGGATIITTVAQVVSNVVDFEMDAQSATAAPRLHHQHLPDVLHFERNGLRPATVQRLRDVGHTVEERPGFQGDLQSIMILSDGTLVGTADPRRGGAAVGLGEVWPVVQ
jgi:gamma-glutamyltranspeptidase / glutathione hydrolase